MADISRVAHVNEYRAYALGKDGQIASYRAFVCAGDADATVWAKQLVGGFGVELWHGDRFVVRLDATGPQAISHEVIDGRMVPKK